MYRFCEGTKILQIDGGVIVGNVNNGGFTVMTNESLEVLNAIKNEKIIDETVLSEEEKTLIQFMLEDELIERNKTSLVAKEKKIKTAYLHINDNCNLNCVGCYSRTSHRNKKDVLSNIEVMEILKKLKIYGVDTIIISGGEPLLHRDIIEILSFAKEKMKIEHIILATNGTVGTTESFQKLSGLVERVSVSIDGYSDSSCDFIRDKGTFEIVMKNIIAMKKCGLNVSLLPTIHKKNYKDIEKFIELSEKMDVPLGFSLLTCNDSCNPLSDYVLEPQEFIEMLSFNGGIDVEIDEISSNVDTLSFKSTCGAAKGMISIDYKGDVYPCHMFQTSELLMGNILQNEIEEILESDNAKKVRNVSVDTISQCKCCDNRYLCGGGCKARIYFENKGFTTEDRYCKGLFLLQERNKQYFSDMISKINKEKEEE